jgi:hypothetical protein
LPVCSQKRWMSADLALLRRPGRRSMTGRPASFLTAPLRVTPTSFSVISVSSVKPRRTTRRLSATTRAPLPPNLDLQLGLDRGEQRVLGQAGVGHGRAGGEEGALEGDALHAQLQLGGAGLLAGDLEGVEVEHADLVVDDELLRPEREAGPGLLAEVGLDDEEAALLQARERVAVAEHRRVGREHDVDVDVFAVDADRLRRRREVVGGGLALLLRTVLRGWP